MARPRKTTATSTGKIGKEHIKERQEQEERIKIDRENLSAPTYLTEKAKEEFAKEKDIGDDVLDKEFEAYIKQEISKTLAVYYK